MTKLSIIVTTYAPYHKYLGLVLSSIDFEPALECEVIVVNDSPLKPIASDGTIRVLNRPETEQRWGAGGARNRGAALARGECVLFVDGDDLILPGALNKMWAAYEQTGGVIYGDLLRTDMGTVWHTKPQYRGSDPNQAPINPTNSAMPYFALVPKAVHEQIGGYVTEQQAVTWEDLIYEADLWAHGIRCHRIEVVTYVYRWTTSGRRSISEDTAIRQTVTAFMYNRYQDFYSGEKKSPFTTGDKDMACGTCGKSPAIGGGAPRPAGTRTLPLAESYETLYLEYAGIHPTRNYRGPATNLVYRFGQPARLRRRKVVEKDPRYVDPTTEIHVEDARQFYTVVRREGVDFTAYTELKAEVMQNPGMIYAPPAEVESVEPVAPVEVPVAALVTPVSDFTVKQMSELLATGAVSNYQAEVWQQEEAADKGRKSMLALLESHVNN